MHAILVTGGAGFIGGSFIRRYVHQAGDQLVNLDLLTYAGNLESLQPVASCANHQFVQGDIRDANLVRQLLRQHQPRAIVHFAAESHVDRSIGAPATFIQTNVVGTLNLLECAREYWHELEPAAQREFRFLHVSTDEVYGSLGPTGRFTEQSPYAPNSPYSASKAGADHLARAYFHTYGLPVLISNCSNNYGPYQFPEKLIPLMILNAIEGKPLPIYGDGANVRDWLHVDDHCEALWQILQGGEPGQVYNIGGDAERTNLQVVETICQVIDQLCPDLLHRPTRQLIQFVTDRPGHDRRYAIDASKIHQELGWRPRHDFEAGIRDTVRWYLDHKDWVRHVCEGTYQRERLGLLNDMNEASQPASQPASEYVEGPIHGLVVRSLKPFTDQRGWLIELFRQDELPDDLQPAMTYVSETLPGVARGPHEHVEQTDYFAFVGPGDFEMHAWDSRPDSATYGHHVCLTVGEQNRCVVIVPPGVVHGYRNVGDKPGWVFNAPNRLYAGPGKQQPVDEIRHEDEADSPYQM